MTLNKQGLYEKKRLFLKLKQVLNLASQATVYDSTNLQRNIQTNKSFTFYFAM